MATISASWTENQTDVDFDDTSPADTVTATAGLDIAASGYDLVVAQISFTWDGSATDYIEIAVYADVNSGGSPDTIPLFSQRLDANAGNADKVSFVLDGLPYVDITFENQSNQEITSLDLVYAGRKFASA